MMHKKSVILSLLIALIIIILDFVTKAWALSLLYAGKLPIAVTSFFNLVYVENTGVSFGFLQGIGDGPLFLIVLSSLITLGLFIWLIRDKNQSLLFKLCLGAAIGGAIGNISDRIRFGAVIDFLDFYVGSYHWPAFNVADSSISIAMICLIILTLRPTK